MKDVINLAWLTQLGLSVAAPLAGFVLLAVWIRDRLGCGSWVLWVGIVLGIISAISGLIHSLMLLSRIQDSEEDPAPPVSFNNHD